MPLLSARFILTLACGLGGAAAAQAESPAGETSPWRLMSELRFGEAHRAFEEIDTPEGRIGLAVSLLGAQPRTRRNISDAEALLKELMTAPDADIAARAAYLHARVPHVHLQPTDWDTAAARYLAAYRAHPGHPLGQRALVRHGITSLFRPMPTEVLRQRLAAFLKLTTQLDDADALRDLSWLLASLHERRLDDPAATLEHVEQLLASPQPMRDITRLNFHVQAGELARELGQPERAAQHYRAFLHGTIRDARVHIIRERLNEVEATR